MRVIPGKGQKQDTSIKDKINKGRKGRYILPARGTHNFSIRNSLSFVGILGSTIFDNVITESEVKRIIQ